MPDNALVFQNGVPNQPGTHVLIVGIGEYPHLMGGAAQDLTVAEGMEQLDAPPISAREMAKWFLDEFDNVEKPLASLAMVLSEASPEDKPARFEHGRKTEPADALPRGSADEVGATIGEWLNRASTNSANQTIFFFCGHGVSAGESILLLRDFGAKVHNRFDGALNLNDFLGGMQTMKPDFQVFLIDACRVPTSISRSVLGKAHVGRAMVDPVDLDLRGGAPAKQSIHHSSSTLEPSYGRLQGASLYTEALVQALDGGGAQANVGYWVSTLGLQTALAAYVSRLAAKEKVEQQPELLRSTQFTIHKPKRLLIPLYVSSSPKEALAKARIEAYLKGNLVGYFDPKEHAAVEEWVVNLEVREHTVHATFHPPSDYEDEPPLEVVVAPPETLCPIQFRRKP